MQVSFLLSISLLPLVEKLRLKIQKQSRKSQLAPLCLEQRLHWYRQWMSTLAQRGVSWAAPTEVCPAVFHWPGYQPGESLVQASPLRQKKLNPLSAGSFIIWEPSTPIRSWESQETWELVVNGQLSELHFYPETQNISFSPGCSKMSDYGLPLGWFVDILSLSTFLWKFLWNNNKYK